MTTEARPTPPDSPLSRGYWEAAARGQLVLQRCGPCGKVRHYPRLLCDQCYSRDVQWVPASGRGRIHSWTVTHHVFHRAFAEAVPYALVTVDLDEGVRAMGRWTGGELAIGAPVDAHFDLSDGRADLFFSPGRDLSPG